MDFRISEVHASDTESLVREVDFPAMEGGPLYRVMFPGSPSNLGEEQREEIIRWYLEGFQEAFECEKTNFLKICTSDGTAAGFCGWTIERRGGGAIDLRDKEIGRLDNQERERRQGKSWLPETLDVLA